MSNDLDLEKLLEGMKPNEINDFVKRLAQAAQDARNSILTAREGSVEAELARYREAEKAPTTQAPLAQAVDTERLWRAERDAYEAEQLKNRHGMAYIERKRALTEERRRLEGERAAQAPTQAEPPPTDNVGELERRYLAEKAQIRRGDLVRLNELKQAYRQRFAKFGYKLND